MTRNISGKVVAPFSLVSTVMTYVFFPPQYRSWLPLVLVSELCVGLATSLWVVLHEATNREHQHAAELTRLEREHAAEVAEAKRRPFNEAQRVEVERRLQMLSEEYRAALRVILFDYPITAHNLAGRLGIPSVDVANSIAQVLRSTDLIATTDDHTRPPSYFVKEQYRAILEDLLFPKETAKAAIVK